ncbi:hypothetical protein EVG20_g11123 [Dentipellis fragilis]|uniref:Uncharacterized protein n=1 Tax=Dentipellis fragilis TaxID=205917 RepID=A0A4Y9XM78_9AGAM|nr:hypothetical protein EVG20_g11123 [Dentipellis fragilis]
MQTAELRYPIELAVGDLCDEPSNFAGVPGRLHLLLERRARWRHLSFRLHEVNTFPFLEHHQKQPEIDFFRNVLFESAGTSGGGMFNPLAVLLSQAPTARYIYRLNIDGRDVEVEKFAVDASRDLLVLLEAHFPDTVHFMGDGSDGYNYDNIDAPVYSLSTVSQFAGTTGSPCVHQTGA